MQLNTHDYNYKILAGYICKIYDNFSSCAFYGFIKTQNYSVQVTRKYGHYIVICARLTERVCHWLRAQLV